MLPKLAKLKALHCASVESCSNEARVNICFSFCVSPPQRSTPAATPAGCEANGRAGGGRTWETRRLGRERGRCWKQPAPLLGRMGCRSLQRFNVASAALASRPSLWPGHRSQVAIPQSLPGTAWQQQARRHYNGPPYRCAPLGTGSGDQLLSRQHPSAHARVVRRGDAGASG